MLFRCIRKKGISGWLLEASVVTAFRHANVALTATRGCCTPLDSSSVSPRVSGVKSYFSRKSKLSSRNLFHSVASLPARIKSSNDFCISNVFIEIVASSFHEEQVKDSLASFCSISKCIVERIFVLQKLIFFLRGSFCLLLLSLFRFIYSIYLFMFINHGKIYIELKI